MPNISSKLAPQSGAGLVVPAIFLAEVMRLSPEFCRLMRKAHEQEREGTWSHAAETVRQAEAYLSLQVEPTLSRESARAFLTRWSQRLEDRFTDRTIRESLQDADLRRPIEKPTQVGPALGVRYPGAELRRRGYVPR